MNNKQRVLFVVLAIIGVLLTLQINGAMAVDKKPLKCNVPAMTPGSLQVPGKDGGDNMYGALTYMFPFTITVLETFDVPALDAQNQPTTAKMHRFSAHYDKPVLVNWCPVHGPEPIPYDIYSIQLPPESLDRFLVEVSLVTCK